MHGRNHPSTINGLFGNLGVELDEFRVEIFMSKLGGKC